jgi:signal transduction histidine kinase
MLGLSAVALLQFLTNILYIFVFLASAGVAIRRNLRADVDVALLFGATALIVAIGWLGGALGLTSSPALVAISSVLVMALPYLLLRLVDDFSGVPNAVDRLVKVGLILSVVGVLGVGQPYPFWLVGLLVLYFLIVEVYGALAFVRVARRSRGVTRLRMQAIASGSLFLGLVILLAGMMAVLPDFAVLWTLLTNVAALASGVSYVAGFAPPVWLRQAWQTPDLRAALRRSAALVRLPDLASIVAEWEQNCAIALGASQAAIGLWDDAARVLHFEKHGQSLAFPLADIVLSRAFTSQRAHFATNMAHANREFAAVYHLEPTMAALIAPITAGKTRYGLVIAYAARAPLFADDDLQLLQVFADQIAVVLENRSLVEETARERARAEALAVAEAERRQLNAELEARVAERTSELQLALQELEAFSYSVSHDLRSPLRTIDGFVQAFLEDYGDRIDPVGQDYLQRTRAASQRMGLLIDGLLQLSRVTRSEMNREVVDLSAVARGVADELQRTQPGRHVTFTIQDGLTAAGDDQLLRVVLENLLGNAWKFTAKQSDARVEFEALKGEQDKVYVVRDNGAGFDMAYAGKLFGPFQRLHGRDEFDGTGIGLATVQRIVRRHGGQIWGEGVVDRGAVFYFTLGPASATIKGGAGSGMRDWRADQEERDLVGGR